MPSIFTQFACLKKPFKHGLIALLLVSTSLSLSACDMKLPPMPWDKPVEETPKDEKDPHAEQPDAGETEEEEPSGPTGELALLPKSMHDLPFEEVTITLPDQLLMYGRLYDPSLQSQGDNEFEDAESYEGKKYPLIILLHGLNRNHTAWSDMPATLVKAGYAVFVVDLRGHGKSTITTKNRRATWRLLQPDQWKLLYKDLGQVITFFKKGEDYPEVDGSQIGVIGERLGANVATYVGKNNEDVKAMVLLSPGLEYKGIDASRGLLDYPNSTLILTNKDNKETYNIANHLYNWITGPKTLQVYQKIGEGADMITNQPIVQEQIRDWLLKTLPNGTAPPEEPTLDTTKDEANQETAKEGHASAHEAPPAHASAKPTEAHH